MKIGDIANLAGTTSDSVRYMTTVYADYLSDSAAGRNRGEQRFFSEQDALVMITVYTLKSQGLPKKQIIQALQGGKLVESLPILPSEQEAEVRKNAQVILKSEYDRMLQQVNFLALELDKARQERDRAINRWQDDTIDLNAKIQQLEHDFGDAKAKLERELGQAKGKLETLETQSRIALESVKEQSERTIETIKEQSTIAIETIKEERKTSDYWLRFVVISIGITVFFAVAVGLLLASNGG